MLLSGPDAIIARRRALCRPSMRPLAALACRIRTEIDTPDAAASRVPDADPMDGGIRAGLLLLLERPGLAALPAGFVSRDNATPTARNLRRFLGETGIPRTRTLIWNAVPWAHPDPARNRSPTRAELAAGLRWLPPLLALLPALRVVVLSGRPAAAAVPVLAAARPDLPVLLMPHPSPTIVCTSPAVPERIRATLSAAARCLFPLPTEPTSCP